MRFSFVAMALVAALGVGTAQADMGAMSGDALKQAISGKTVYLDTPYGLALPISYRPDGTMSARAGQLASYVGSANDSGSWWVSRNRVCHKWSQWLKGETHCVTLSQSGGTIHWKSDEGTTGTARIASR
jgi:hypothetical protein